MAQTLRGGETWGQRIHISKWQDDVRAHLILCSVLNLSENVDSVEQMHFRTQKIHFINMQFLAFNCLECAPHKLWPVCLCQCQPIYLIPSATINSLIHLCSRYFKHRSPCNFMHVAWMSLVWVGAGERKNHHNAIHTDPITFGPYPLMEMAAWNVSLLLHLTPSAVSILALTPTCAFASTNKFIFFLCFHILSFNLIHRITKAETADAARIFRIKVRIRLADARSPSRLRSAIAWHSQMSSNKYRIQSTRMLR